MDFENRSSRSNYLGCLRLSYGHRHFGNTAAIAWKDTSYVADPLVR